tara:strand:+ start:1292 stop:1687 length:396 start_codon:yes stop_codon:yes gene_type:complete
VIDVTCAILQRRDGKILAAQRARNAHLPLKWEFPGGKVDEGEDPERCIVRELQEELGVTVEIIDRMEPNVHHYDEKSVRLIPFWCDITQGHPTSLEHEQIEWISPDRLDTLDWCEADIPIVASVIRKASGC